MFLDCYAVAKSVETAQLLYVKKWENAGLRVLSHLQTYAIFGAFYCNYMQLLHMYAIEIIANICNKSTKIAEVGKFSLLHLSYLQLLQLQ